jgi:hypothetical protein
MVTSQRTLDDIKHDTYDAEQSPFSPSKLEKVIEVPEE